MKSFILSNLLGFSILLGLCSAPVIAGTAVQVNVSGLNVRSGPSTGYSTLGQIWNAQKYSNEGSSGSWNLIRFDNRLGYVYGGSNYSSTTTAPLGTITASALNVRTGPGSNYGAVGQVLNGQRFVLTGSTSGSWLQIYHGGNKRWVYGSYVSQERTPAPPPPPAPVASSINVSHFSLGAGSPTTTSSRFITTRHFYQSNGASVRDYRMSENANFSGAAWRTYTGRPNVTLSTGNGTKRVYFQLRDTNFRLSNARSDTINLQVFTPPPPGSSSQMLWPITAAAGSPAGYRIHPIGGDRRLHKGRDFGSPNGTSVYSSAPGVITQDFNDYSCGGIIKIKHDNGYSTRYLHVDNSALSVGDRVRAGQFLTRVMRTLPQHHTCTTGDHLHFEILNPNGAANIDWDDGVARGTQVTAGSAIPYQF